MGRLLVRVVRMWLGALCTRPEHFNWEELMPEKRGKHWYIGDKRYSSKAAAERAWKAYQAKKHSKKRKKG